MENQEQITKQQVAARVDSVVFAAIEKIAAEEERSISNTVERLLKKSPQVRDLLESQETAGASA